MQREDLKDIKTGNIDYFNSKKSDEKFESSEISMKS